MNLPKPVRYLDPATDEQGQPRHCRRIELIPKVEWTPPDPPAVASIEPSGSREILGEADFEPTRWAHQ